MTSALTSCHLLSLPIADAVVIGCMHPVITAVAAWALLGEDLGMVQILGCLVSVCGVVVIAQPDSLASPDALQEQRLYGVAMGIASAVLSTGECFV
jgi:drug/metabolite transporter (DMT)-like permease